MKRQRLVRWLLAHPKLVWGFWIALTLFSLPGLFRLNINPDLSSLQSETHPEVQRFLKWRHDGAPFYPVLVRFTGLDAVADDFLKQVCNPKAGLIEICLTRLGEPGLSGAALLPPEVADLSTFAPGQPAAIRWMAWLRHKLRSSEGVEDRDAATLSAIPPPLDLDAHGNLFRHTPPKGRVALLFPIRDPVETTFNQYLIAGLNKAADQAIARHAAAGKARVTFSGFAMMANEEAQHLFLGFLLANAAMLLTVGLVIGLFYPVLKPTLRMMACMAWLALICIGLAGWLVGNINAISMSFVATVIGLGVNEGVYLLVLCQGLGGQERLEKVIAVCPALFITAMTTAAGFGALALSGVKAFEDLGVLSAVSLILCLVFMLSLWPHLMGPPVHHSRLAKATALSGLTARFSPVAGLLMFGLLAGLVIKGPPRFDLSYLSLLPDLPSVHAYLQEKGGAFRSDLYLVKAPSLKASAALARKLEKLPQVEGVLAIRSKNLQGEGVSAQKFRPLKTYEQDFLEASGNLLATVDDQRLQAELSGDHSALKFLDRLTRLTRQAQQRWPDLHSEAWDAFLSPQPPAAAPGSLHRLLHPRPGVYFLVLRPKFPLLEDRHFLSLERALHVLKADAWGPSRLFYGFTRSVHEGFPRAFGAALAVSLLLLFLGLKRPGAVLTAVLPLGACLAVTWGALAWWEWLGPVSCAALPILVATCIDGPVMVRQTLLQEGAAGLSRAAQGLCLTQGTTIAAFGSLGLLRHPGISHMGLLVSLGVLAALFYSLWWTPWLMRRNAAPAN